ncbi:MAG TPA: hypothetical protein VNW53_17455 [Phenylobacterium sp.]|jgi:hypothetical protein|uniref:hypothetical protein n=1 Tax=Phenylobacterium sp. TaxID=1871053 RepID=UPI002B8492B5|nr:hypothetical protein [Phenylobacterium sp.]HXA40790.1 hypothetical protein [Phenylobacterium sp.]
MSSISPLSQTPPSIPVTPAAPVSNSKPPVTSATDSDGDKDGSTSSPSAAKPPGVGNLVDIKA